MSWTYRGQERPPFAEEPGPGQESVWDYPRPPRVERDDRRVRVAVEGVTVADTGRAVRVLETAAPPTFYIPAEDVRTDLLTPAGSGSICEWKGQAVYYDLEVDGRVVQGAAWSYPAPRQSYRELKDHIAFYAGKVDEAWVGDARVTPQPGRFYGGWVTPEVVGPFKGEPGTGGW